MESNTLPILVTLTQSQLDEQIDALWSRVKAAQDAEAPTLELGTVRGFLTREDCAEYVRLRVGLYAIAERYRLRHATIKFAAELPRNIGASFDNLSSWVNCCHTSLYERDGETHIHISKGQYCYGGKSGLVSSYLVAPIKGNYRDLEICDQIIADGLWPKNLRDYMSTLKFDAEAFLGVIAVNPAMAEIVDIGTAASAKGSIQAPIAL